MQEKTPKLYLNMILAETEPAEMVKRSIDSVKDYVDGMYIAITYKDQEPPLNTKLATLLSSYNANILYFKWIDDFSAARQFVMDNTPHGADSFIYWQDADDLLQNGEALRQVTNEAITFNHAAVFFNYLYLVELDDQGNVREVLVEHKRERVIRNDGSFKWIGMLHETLIEQRTENIIKVPRDECVIVHLSDGKRGEESLNRNIRILEKQAEKEQHKDPRTIIYLGKAYFDKAKMQTDPTQQKIDFDLSYMLLEEYLNGVGQPGTPGYQEASGWPEERATAWSYISEIAKVRGQYNLAIRALHNAIIEAPQFPNYYVDMAMVYSMQGNVQKAKHWLRLATDVQMPDTTLVTTPRDLKVRALEVDYNIALAEGKFDQAERDSELLCEIIPNLQALKDRHITVQSINAYNKACQSVVYLGKYLEQIKETDKISHLVKAIPQDMQMEKFASEMKHLFMPARTWGSDEIAILCGPGFEEWSPKSTQTGLGGSEEAVVYLSQELAKLGWKVTVYANPGKEIGNHQGVEYKMWHDFNQKDKFNILILWRNIGMVDYDLQAKFKMVWMHDVPSNPDFTQQRVGQVDKIAVMSEYHKSLFRMQTITGEFTNIPDEKIFVTSNGIPGLSINTKWKRKPHSLIYASSLDRGLIYLLNNWKELKTLVPDVTLDVFYGFEIFDKIHANNPARQQWKHYILELMKQDGITYHGRIGHQQLTKEFSTHEVWAYPTDFQEISCISAMKAQACGAIPVTTNFAALKETIKNGFKVDVDITTPEGQKEYIQELAKILNNNKTQEIRSLMMKFAQEYFLWDKVAKNWHELFRQKIKGGV